MKAKPGIVAFSFGTPARKASNMAIAGIAAKVSNELGAPVFTQRDVDFSALEKKPVAFTYVLGEVPGRPPSTLYMARGAVKWAMKLDAKELIVVAAKPHIWRCLRDLEYVIQKSGVPVEVILCKQIFEYPDENWFQMDSFDSRTRTTKNWWRAENILRMMPMWMYKALAFFTDRVYRIA